MRAMLLMAILGVGCWRSQPAAPEPPRNTVEHRADHPPEGIGSKDELFASIVAALASKSTGPLAPAIPSVATVEALCPEKIAADGREDIETALRRAQVQMRTWFEPCWKRGDLAAATLVEPHGESIESVPECSGMASGGTADLVIRAGAMELVVRVRWGVSAAGRVYLDDPPDCRDP